MFPAERISTLRVKSLFSSHWTQKPWNRKLWNLWTSLQISFNFSFILISRWKSPSSYLCFFFICCNHEFLSRFHSLILCLTLFSFAFIWLILFQHSYLSYVENHYTHICGIIIATREWNVFLFHFMSNWWQFRTRVWFCTGAANIAWPSAFLEDSYQIFWALHFFFNFNYWLIWIRLS